MSFKYFLEIRGKAQKKEAIYKATKGTNIETMSN